MIELKYEYTDDLGHYYIIAIPKNKLKVWLSDSNVNVISYASLDEVIKRRKNNERNDI